AAGNDKPLKELYAGGRSFSTSGGTDRMSMEGRPMRIRVGFVFLALLAAATAIAVPQTKKTPAGHDPQMIDAPAYQKLLEKYRGKPVLVNFWATWCEPCRDEYPMLNELAKQYA